MKTCHSEDVLPRLIYQTSLRLQVHADRLLQPLGITLEQLHPLKILGREGGTIGQRQMCDLAGKTPANMTRILDRLANKRLLARQPDREDRRAFTIVLTPAGEDLIEQAMALFSGYLDQVLAGVGEEEEAVCRRVLQRIDQNLAGLAPGEIPGNEQN